MENRATEMLISATIDFLRDFPPFDRMEQDTLVFLAERLKLAYFPKDTVIIDPDDGVVQVFRIVQRGKVVARQTADVSAMEQSTLMLGPGEGFPMGSITAQRVSTNRYIAVSDAFCYELTAEDFFLLLQKSTVYNLFCTQYIASLLWQSRQRLQGQFSQRVAEQQTMNSPIASLLKKEAISVTRQRAIREVVEIMASQAIGSMIVVDEAEHPVGIFTQSDVLKRIVLRGASLDQPIETVMSPNPHTLPLSATAYDAALALAKYGIHHILAVDDGGRLKGAISERDLFALQRVGLRQIRQSIDTASSVDLLLQASRDVKQLSLNMLAQGVGAEQITHFISALNDALTRRILRLNIEKIETIDIEWAWLSFGSEGRDEQTFSTDQDNGIVFICPDAMNREEVRSKLIVFAKCVNDDLAHCGFPLCAGGIMASNPEWCLTLDEWKARFEHWVREPQPNALLNATIFFDFRPLYGKSDLADKMRSFLLGQAQGNAIFLRMMAENALSVLPPLGKIRDFVTDEDEGHPGAIDLKKFGSRLFIDAVRIFALARGIAATNTVQRFKQISKPLHFSEEETSAIIDAFNFIQHLRLHRQQAEQQQGREGDNWIRPDDLNEVERRILKESFRQARRLQQRLKLDYQL